MAPRVLAILMVATFLTAASAVTASCTRYVDAEPVASDELGSADSGVTGADASACAHVDAPLTDIEPVEDNEPVLRIPQPDGWERYTAMDSELIRFTMSSVDLASDDFAPTVVVTLESKSGIEDAADVFDAQRASLEDGFGATDLTVSEEELCGLPAEFVSYTTPPMGAVGQLPAMVMMSVLQTDDRTFAVTVTSQTKDPADPRYQDQTEQILRGFQMLAPSEG
jgi:hypothetical protein